MNQLQALVSPIDNDDAGLKINQDAWIYRTTLEAGKSITNPLHNPNCGLYMFVIDGAIEVNGEALNKRYAAGISETDAVTFTASKTSDVLLVEVPMKF